jgi:hypothetical protein
MAASGYIVGSTYTNTICFNVAAASCHYWTSMWASAVAGNCITDPNYWLTFYKHVTRTLYNWASGNVSAIISCYTWHD